MRGRCLLVILIAASPIGEEPVATPAGIVQGLPPESVAVIALVFNYVPALFTRWHFSVRSGAPLLPVAAASAKSKGC
jgi:hypothetical protein